MLRLLWVLLVLGLVTALMGACGDEAEVAISGSATSSPGSEGDAPSPTSANTQVPTPSGWKSIVNSKYGYSVAVPEGWLVDPADATESDFVTIWNLPPPSSGELPNPQLLQFQLISYSTAPEETLDAWLSNHDQNAPNRVTIHSRAETSINGADAILRLESYEGEGSGAPFYVHYVRTLEAIVAITGRPSDDSPLATIADQVLATFRAEQ